MASVLSWEEGVCVASVVGWEEGVCVASVASVVSWEEVDEETVFKCMN